jgi:hypothetical protein
VVGGGSEVGNCYRGAKLKTFPANYRHRSVTGLNVDLTGCGDPGGEFLKGMNVNAEQFEKILDRRLELTKQVLAKKRKEYAGDDGDRLHNFNRAAAMLGVSREKALLGMWTKHIVSILDIVDGLSPVNVPTMELIEEKVGDAVNYLILLEAMLKERAKKS